MPWVGLTLFIHTTAPISVLIVLLGLYLLVSALFVSYVAKMKTVLLNSLFKAFLRFWHCKSFSLGKEGGRRRYSACLQTCKSLLLVCLSKIWGVDRYCCCFTLSNCFLVVLFFVSFRCALFKFLSCKRSFLISTVMDYPSSFASVGFRFLSNVFFFLWIVYSSEKIYLKCLEQQNYAFPFCLNKLATYILIFCHCVY